MLGVDNQVDCILREKSFTLESVLKSQLLLPSKKKTDGVSSSLTYFTRKLLACSTRKSTS